MADSTHVFPQIPSTVWWGIRDQFKKSIPGKVSESYLSAQLNVQGTAAKQYVGELKRAGILDAEGKPTEVVKKWRMDDTYADAAEQILKSAYPQELIDLAPPAEGDRAKAIRWFMGTADLGEGAAKNKTATYFLLGSPTPPEDAAVPREKKPVRQKANVKVPTSAQGSEITEVKVPPAPPSKSREDAAGFPLNVNVQIHISADATSDQIESIFANMKKYLAG